MLATYFPWHTSCPPNQHGYKHRSSLRSRLPPGNGKPMVGHGALQSAVASKPPTTPSICTALFSKDSSPRPDEPNYQVSGEGLTPNTRSSTSSVYQQSDDAQQNRLPSTSRSTNTRTTDRLSRACLRDTTICSGCCTPKDNPRTRQPYAISYVLVG